MAGHDLRRTDEPLPELDALIDIIVAAVALVRTVDRAALEGVDLTRFERLAAAIEAAGISAEPAAISTDATASA